MRSFDDRIRRPRGAAVAVVVVALVIAACSGDDDADPATTPASSESTISTTADLPSTTDDTTTTTAAPTTTTTTISIAPPPTVEPTTTSEPGDEFARRLAVIDAVEMAWQAKVDVLRDPTSDEKLQRLGDVYRGVLLDGFGNLVEQYRDENLRTVVNPKQDDDLTLEPASLAISEDGNFATIQACDVTAGIVVEGGGNADGSDRVIDDRVGRVVVQFDVVLVDGTWKVERGQAVDESERIAQCD
ncbi:MAG: hypothetical protein ABIP17_03840 [Ilumatobacteraceae bacterium]